MLLCGEKGTRKYHVVTFRQACNDLCVLGFFFFFPSSLSFCGQEESGESVRVIQVESSGGLGGGGYGAEVQAGVQAGRRV